MKHLMGLGLAGVLGIVAAVLNWFGFLVWRFRMSLYL